MKLSMRTLAPITLLVGAALACSAGTEDTGDGTGGRSAATGGAAATDTPLGTGGTGFGGASSDIVPECDNPLFSCGAYTSVDATDDPCKAAQVWEDGILLDLTTGQLVLKDGKVYEVTGVGLAEYEYTNEWVAPPCSNTSDDRCVSLGYAEIATCTG